DQASPRRGIALRRPEGERQGPGRAWRGRARLEVQLVDAMPIHMLTDELRFPPPEGASAEGIVAIGGDFRPERVLLGYAQGIFPWPSEGLPLLWFSPDPRFALEPRRAHIPRSVRKRLKKMDYEVRFDTAFATVIRACAGTRRPGQRGTWITQDLM